MIVDLNERAQTIRLLQANRTIKAAREGEFCWGGNTEQKVDHNEGTSYRGLGEEYSRLQAGAIAVADAQR